MARVRLRVVIPLAVAVVGLLAGGVTTAAVRSESGSTSGTSGAAGASTSSSTTTPPPSSWDPRVIDIVRFLEKERGLRFSHPVFVDFLTDTDFNAKLTSDQTPTAEERADMDTFVETLRALGMVSGQLDLRQASNTLVEREILGLYSNEAKLVYVRGSTMTPDVKETVAHELTHALQDQHFDLERFDEDPSGVSTGYRTLFEADAMRVAAAYVDSLPAAEQKAVTETRSDQVKDSRQATDSGVPDILGDLLSLPYVFGPAFVAALENDGGNAAIDRAFGKPPKSEAQILDPQLYLAGTEPVKVKAPKLAENQKRVDEPDDFGQLSMALVLGQRLDFARAWPPVQGWAGDQYVTYREGGRLCVAVATVLRNAADGDHFLSAAAAWSAAMPAASARRTSPTAVELRSCDPGSARPTRTPPQPSPFDVLAVRSEIIAGAEQAGAPVAIAKCAVDRLLAEVGPATLADLTNVDSENDPRVKRLQPIVQRGALACAREPGRR